MSTDYVYNIIMRILGERKNNIPNNVPYNELAEEVLDDLKLATNELVSEGRIKFSRDLNGNPLFYAVD